MSVRDEVVEGEEEDVSTAASITKKDSCNSLAAGAGMTFSATKYACKALSNVSNKNSSTSYKGIESKASFRSQVHFEFEGKPADGLGKK